MSTILAGTGWTVLEDLSRAERVRIARYAALSSNLTTGDISPQTFRRRVNSWAPIRGELFESDPSVVLAILDDRRQGGEETFEYRGRRR